ncbi:adenylate kinase family protein [Plantactinospora endophytica]|uniref:Adenylate kinase n=1 Tax=Plantactinospora endophytica TaxID=673535 RepID=A0ABQ4E172_9ACTN|nr:nucleoside monophosphate kinase [Plantactinospora endophytica]GIG88036.1 adenylate kinase [Plantactinospora endophytica]
MPTTPATVAATDRHADVPVMILTGPPGAGKSTAMRAFRRRFPGLIHFGVRVFFERQIEQGTPLGLRAKKFHDTKVWHPDELIFDGIASWLDEGLPAATRVVLEGFPRNRSQARALDGVLGDRGLRVDRLVYLNVPDEVAAARVMTREVCTSCETIVADAIPVPGTACVRCGRQLVRRPDDDQQTFRRRLARQRQGAVELLDHYEALGVVVRIDGTSPPAQVAAALEVAAPAAQIAARRIQQPATRGA